MHILIVLANKCEETFVFWSEITEGELPSEPCTPMKPIRRLDPEGYIILVELRPYRQVVDEREQGCQENKDPRVDPAMKYLQRFYSSTEVLEEAFDAAGIKILEFPLHNPKISHVGEESKGIQVFLWDSYLHINGEVAYAGKPVL
jgi:hypothetical protein